MGFFNKTGEWIIAAEFENVRDFKNGFAAAKSNGLWGFIDKKGNWIIQPTYVNVKDMNLVN